MRRPTDHLGQHAAPRRATVNIKRLFPLPLRALRCVARDIETLSASLFLSPRNATHSRNGNTALRSFSAYLELHGTVPASCSPPQPVKRVLLRVSLARRGARWRVGGLVVLFTNAFQPGIEWLRLFMSKLNVTGRRTASPLRDPRT